MKHLFRRSLACLLAVLLLPGLSGCGAISLMLNTVFSDTVHVYEDVAEYARFAGANPEEEYEIDSLDLEGDIFPAAIPEGAEVRNFKMVYYNPFDAQWLCYLTVQYTPEAYAAEAERLAAFPRDDYEGVFSVTGFPTEPLALTVDRTAGFLYAIPTPDLPDAVTYVRIEFGNRFLDLDWTEYVPAQYLPIGFDASPDNPWMEQADGQGN